MKKNYVMRFAAILLVLVLLSTCVVSGTFAKYVTSGTATDTAKVAKWGVTVTAEACKDDQLEADLETSETEILASANTDLLAPGTGVKFASFTMTGTPEVAVKVTYSATLTLSNWDVAYDQNGDGNNETGYCPLVFIVNETVIQDTNIDNLITKVQKAINDYSNTYTAGTDLSTVAEDTLTVSAKWVYENSTDALDTALGNAAADDNDANDPTVSLSITCTVTQVD